MGGEGKLGQGRAGVDEKPRAGREHRAQPGKGAVAGLGMTPVEGADTQREGKVIGRFAGQEHQILGRAVAQGDQARRDPFATAGAGLGDGLGRPVDTKDMARGTDDPRHFAQRHAGAAAQFQHAQAGAQRQRGDSRRDAGRCRRHPGCRQGAETIQCVPWRSLSIPKPSDQKVGAKPMITAPP